MNHQLEKEELERLVSAFRNDLSIYKSPNSNYNEQNTRQQYIDNFLKLLGWDISNPQNLNFNNREVVAEEYSNRTDRPDYTIRMYGSSLFYVEAKKVSIDITKDLEPALQARRYGWNSGHQISVLTNFEYFAIYQTFEAPTELDAVSKFRYKLYNFEEYIEKFDEIYRLLSRESVLDGTFKQWTSEITPEDATKLSLDNTFLNQLNEWRLQIAKDLYECGLADFQDLVVINESVQTLLNQLIFLRFAEDNNFENQAQLKHSIDKHVNYTEYFRTLDLKYNSGIFEQPEIILNVKESTLENIVENLYFPNVSYDFSVIDLVILSRIYENFLQQEITFDISGNLILDHTQSAKIKSVVSTPDSVAKLMIQNGLEDIIQGKSPAEIKQLKIGDIAVGSGIFLIEAYNYIENYLIDWYSEADKVSPTPYIVPFETKKEIIKNVLYGFDINNQAIQLTRFSLLLRLLANEKRERVEEIFPIFPSLEGNIICGNSLVNENDLELEQLDYEVFKEIQPMLSEMLEDKSFDFIIGNPPYLTTKDIKNSTPQEEIEVYFSKYNSTFKQYDKYFLFIERCLSLLKNEGIAVLLVPNKFFTVGAARNLRDFLVNKQGIVSIVDFKTKQLFSNVITYLSIIKFGRFNEEKLLYSERESAEEAFVSSTILEYSIKDLGSNPWFLTTDDDLRKKYSALMDRLPRMTEVINPVNGIQTSANDIYIIEKKFVVSDDGNLVRFHIKKGKRDEEFSIEKALLRDFYRPLRKEIGKSYTNIISNDYVIFPYQKGKLFNFAEMEKNYPNTLNYFENHKELLLPKEMGGKRDVPDPKEYYQFGRTQFLREASADKIIVGVMSNQPNFNIDRSGMMVASGGTAGYVGLFNRMDSPYTLEYIQAWLSHPITDIIFQTIGSSFEGDFYTHGTSTYADIPFMKIDFDNSDQTAKYNEIVKKVQEIEELNNQKLTANLKQVAFIEKQKLSKIKRINNIFDELIYQVLEQELDNE